MAVRQVSRELRVALEHAARNIRRVAEQQRPRPWSIAVEPGVRVSQRVEPLRNDWLLHSGRPFFAHFDAADDRNSRTGGGCAPHRGRMSQG